jgi:mono/diheme cytochrome c family protein
MHPILKVAGALAAVAVAGAVAFPFHTYLASEALIERRYPLPAIAEPAAPAPVMVARGEHLARIAGCGDCHGASFEGRRTRDSGVSGLWSSNLRLAAANLSEGEFERALRRGIAPDATSLWAMPSKDYMYMSENDVAALLAYLRSIGATGPLRHGPKWDTRARRALLDGRIIPAVLAVRDAPSSLDLGPRYDGGRYLARIACSECHGTDLEGGPTHGVPDLDMISLYSRSAFFDLLRRGRGADGRRVPVMRRLSMVRFHVFADYEIMALYDYLDARTHAPPALVARAKANEARRKAEIAASSEE